MALAGLTEYKQLVSFDGSGIYQDLKVHATSTTVNKSKSSHALSNGKTQGATPIGPLACTNTTAGALYGSPAVDSILVGVNLSTNLNGGMALLVDRLCHQGQLSAATTTPQTLNLPTATLTRYTSGEGVRAALEIYATLGTLRSTFTVSYTNQDGVSSTSPVMAYGGLGATGDREVGHMAEIPLNVGDTGFRSVESVTLATSTGTAGNFGVTLFKPLLALPLGNQSQPRMFDILNSDLPVVIPAESCLEWIIYPGSSTGSPFFASTFYMREA